MKKTFNLTDEKIAPARLVESIKNEVRKYIRRERNKALPAGVDFWDFDCRFGANANDSETIHLAEIDDYINQAEANEWESLYLEIISKPGHRQRKPMLMDDADDFDNDFDDRYENDFGYGYNDDQD